MSSKRAMSQKQMEVNAARKQSILTAVEGISVSDTIKKITDSGLAINETFQAMNVKVMTLVQELTNIDEAIRIKKEELSKLYSQEQVLRELDQLQADFDQRKADLKKEINEIHQSVLDAQAAATTARLRDEEQYQYNLSRQRQRDQDDFRAKLDSQQRMENSFAAERTKALDERENALKVREDELKTLKEQVANFPGILAKEKETAGHIVGSKIKADYEVKLTLAAKDLETTVKVKDMQIMSLNQTNENQQDQIRSLQEQLTQARAQVQSISEKALESASSTKAMAEVQTVLANRNDGQKR